MALFVLVVKYKYNHITFLLFESILTLHTCLKLWHGTVYLSLNAGAAGFVTNLLLQIETARPLRSYGTTLFCLREKKDW